MNCLTPKRDTKYIIILVLSWSTQPIYKSFMLMEVDEGSRLNYITDVKVDLSKLRRFFGNFDINNIQKEVCIQMRVEGTMVVLHKNGTPVKDTSNTWGKRYWEYLLNMGLVFLRKIFVGYFLWILQFLKTKNAYLSLN